MLCISEPEQCGSRLSYTFGTSSELSIGNIFLRFKQIVPKDFCWKIHIICIKQETKCTRLFYWNDLFILNRMCVNQHCHIPLWSTTSFDEVHIDIIGFKEIIPYIEIYFDDFQDGTLEPKIYCTQSYFPGGWHIISNDCTYSNLISEPVDEICIVSDYNLTSEDLILQSEKNSYSPYMLDKQCDPEDPDTEYTYWKPIYYDPFTIKLASDEFIIHARIFISVYDVVK